MFSSDKRNILIILILLGALYFIGLGSHGLLEPDEGRYSEIPREMLESSDFITPRLNYVAYFEKPVFHYWLTAASFKLFGQNEFAARFCPAFLALAGVFAVYFLGKQMWGSEAAFCSSMVLGTSLVYFATSQINITDMTLSFFITLSLVGFWMGIKKNKPFLHLFYGGMALAVLTKGLIGLVLPGGIVFWWIILTRQWALIRKTIYLPGIIVFFFLCAPWFVAVCLENPDFFHFFFIQEHFLRYTTKMHGRYQPLWFFVPIILVGMTPWTGFLPGALKNIFPMRLKKIDEKDQSSLFLLVWFLVIFVFFSASSSKLVPYIIPALAPLALFIGHYIYSKFVVSCRFENIRGSLILNSAFLVLFASALAAFPFFDDEYGTMLVSYALPVSFSLFLGVLLTWYSYRQQYKQFLLPVLFACGVICMLAFKNVFGFYGNIMSAKEIAAVVQENISEGDILAEFREYDQGLPFYTGRRVLLIDWRGELEFGANKDGGGEWFLSTDDFLEKLWKSEKRVVLVIKENENMEFLEKTGYKPVLLGSGYNRLVLANHK